MDVARLSPASGRMVPLDPRRCRRWWPRPGTPDRPADRPRDRRPRRRGRRHRPAVELELPRIRPHTPRKTSGPAPSTVGRPSGPAADGDASSRSRYCPAVGQCDVDLDLVGVPTGSDGLDPDPGQPNAPRSSSTKTGPKSTHLRVVGRLANISSRSGRRPAGQVSSHDSLLLVHSAGQCQVLGETTDGWRRGVHPSEIRRIGLGYGSRLAAFCAHQCAMPASNPSLTGRPSQACTDAGPPEGSTAIAVKSMSKKRAPAAPARNRHTRRIPVDHCATLSSPRYRRSR